MVGSPVVPHGVLDHPWDFAGCPQSDYSPNTFTPHDAPPPVARGTEHTWGDLTGRGRNSPPGVRKQDDRTAGNVAGGRPGMPCRHEAPPLSPPPPAAAAEQAHPRTANAPADPKPGRHAREPSGICKAGAPPPVWGACAPQEKAAAPPPSLNQRARGEGGGGRRTRAWLQPPGRGCGGRLPWHALQA